jgi:hypothetical protein
MGRYGLDCFCSVYGPTEGSCECDNEPSGSGLVSQINFHVKVAALENFEEF